MAENTLLFYSAATRISVETRCAKLLMTTTCGKVRTAEKSHHIAILNIDMPHFSDTKATLSHKVALSLNVNKFGILAWGCQSNVVRSIWSQTNSALGQVSAYYGNSPTSSLCHCRTKKWKLWSSELRENIHIVSTFRRLVRMYNGWSFFLKSMTGKCVYSDYIERAEYENVVYVCFVTGENVTIIKITLKSCLYFCVMYM